MLAKRIIPCLDIKNGRTVKGVNFENLIDAGDPVQLARKYYADGADELVLLDISATLEGRETFLDVIRNVAKAIAIPLTVGGGISTLEQAKKLIRAGADKVSINTAAVQNPELIKQLADYFGSQCVVVAIDTMLTEEGWVVVSHAGNRKTGLKAFDWAKTCEKLKAGEILLTSHTSDGKKEGFAIDITRRISQSLSIPVIASGGAGLPEHFAEVLTHGNADAALAAGVFHYGLLSIRQVKEYLKNKNIMVRY